MSFFKLSIAFFLLTMFFTSCNNRKESDSKTAVKALDVNPNFFIKENIIGDIKKEKVNLNGIETLCYIFQTNSQATDHQMGPWCPRHIDDTNEKGGIWFNDGKVYDVNGHFIANLNEFYKDDKWNLVRKGGTIKYTTNKEACLGAAKPDVEEEYKNHCVECLPEYFNHQITTYTIPVTPQYFDKTEKFKRGAIGLAFNGVNFDPPAPIHAILAANTIAPLDDAGGHVNPHGGYHYHTATGKTKEIKQKDSHAPMIGYAIDGFPIYAYLDENGKAPTDLDECGGQVDEIRGYHYHAGKPGSNQIIKCFRGNPGNAKVKE